MRRRCSELGLAAPTRNTVERRMVSRQVAELAFLARAMLPHSLYELLQILILTMFETTPINQLLSPPTPPPDGDQQLVLL